MYSDDDIFITQSKFSLESPEENDTDTEIEAALDLLSDEKEIMLEYPHFSDISED